ncbi:MAG: hypothetical protein NC033_05625 [Clostridiales bacterium]|nr:hypothetical protein [Clostridiales bacterium]
MDEKQNELEETVGKEEEGVGEEITEMPEIITPWYIITLIKPIIREEFIATCRYDRTGIRLKFLNGQKFHISVKEME